MEATNKGRKLAQIASPFCPMLFNYFFQPDKKYKKFGTNLRVDPKSESGKAFLDALKTASDEQFALEHPKIKKDADRYRVAYPFKKEQRKDENGDYHDTGFMLVTVRSTRPPRVEDAKKNVVPSKTQVWSESIGRVSCLLNPYVSTSRHEIGVSLWLQAVQIKELKTGNGGAASAFDAVDGLDISKEGISETAMEETEDNQEEKGNF